jgi:hypothetical protein
VSETRHSPEGSDIADDPAIFAFEKDFAQSLRCIPMSVRLKLDSVGVKLSLRQWNRLGRPERRALLHLPCDLVAQRAAFREQLMRMLQAQDGAAAASLPVDPQPPWEDQQRVPAQLQDYLAGRQLPALSLSQWRALNVVQRFALLKLSRPAHDNDNFLPALREFGLLQAPATTAED